VNLKLLVAYFVIGGLIVSVITYFGSQGKSELAAFIAFLPATSLITVCTIYFAGGIGGSRHLEVQSAGFNHNLRGK
jgi:hypothetical protein